MFSWCSLLSSLPDISKWNTNNVTNMSSMFYDCNPSLIIPKDCNPSLIIPKKFKKY